MKRMNWALVPALLVAWAVPVATQAAADSNAPHYLATWSTAGSEDQVPQWRFTDNVPTGAFRSRIIDGSHRWNDVANVNMRFDHVVGDLGGARWDDNCAAYTGYQDDRVTYGDLNANQQDNSLAEAKWCYTGGGNMKNFRIKFSNDYSWFTGTSTAVPSNQYDLLSVATHEFGHATGADDINNGTASCPSAGADRATMCESIGPGQYYQRSLHSLDINAFQAAY